MKRIILAALVGASLSSIVLAQQHGHAVPTATASSGDVRFVDAWARSTGPGQKVTGVFMRIESAKGAAIVGGKSAAAATVELHETVREGDVMKMRPLPRFVVPAAGALELKPGAHHVMLIDLRQPLKEGEAVPLTLLVEQGGATREVVLSVPVRAAGNAPAKHSGHH